MAFLGVFSIHISFQVIIAQFLYHVVRLFDRKGNIDLYGLGGVDLLSLIDKSRTVSSSDYSWLSKSSRGGIKGNVVKNIGKLYLIYTKILQADLRRPRDQSHKMYVNIATSKFWQYIPNKNDVLIIKRLLEASGVIDINRKSSKGGSGYKAFAQGYRINAKYLDSKRIRLYRKDNPKQEIYYFLENTYQRWGKSTVKKSVILDSGENDVTDIEVDTIKDTSLVFKWLEDCHKRVDINMDLVESTLNEHLKLPDTKKRITALEYNKALDRADTIFRFNSTYPTAPNFTRSIAVGRISCNINRLNKILRPALSYQGHKIHWIDVHACHPFLLQCLYDFIPETKQALAERKKYNNLFKSEDKNFYLNFLKLNSNDELDVSKIKNDFLGGRGLFSRYQKTRKHFVGKVYCDHFPILDKQMMIIKTDR